MQAIADEICQELPTTYVTIETRAYAELCAAVQVLAGPGAVQKYIADTPIWLVDDPEPDVPLDRGAAKAIHVMSWGDNGLKAVDKACYELVLRMTHSQPEHDDPFVRVNLQAIGKRLGVSAGTASKVLWGLSDLGLLEAERHKDENTGHNYIAARAGQMPVYGTRYASTPQRSQDASRKRVCPDCGGTRFDIRYICRGCGVVHRDPPHSEELVDELAEQDCKQPASQIVDSYIETSYIANTSTTCSQPVAEVDPPTDSVCGQYGQGPSIDHDSDLRGGLGGPPTESVCGQYGHVAKIYHIDPCNPDRWTCVCGNRVWESHSDRRGGELYCDRCRLPF